MAIDLSRPFVRTSSVVGGEVAGEIVLVSIEDGNYYGFDTIGTAIWRHLEEPKTIDMLTTELQDHFDGDPATIEAEVLAFLNKLADHKLLTEAGPA